MIFFPVVPSQYSEATTGGVLLESVFVEISQNSQENNCARVFLFFNAVAGLPWRSANFSKVAGHQLY